MNEVRLGIVGLGGMGGHYARNILLKGEVPGLELSAVCDSRAEVAGQFPEARYFSDAQEMYASGRVDAVLIATPHFSHRPLGVAALEAGLHVMVEKPISVHKSDAEKLVAALQGSGKVGAAMFLMRTYPVFRKLKALIEDGELGQIRRVNWTVTDWFRTQAYYDAGTWRGSWAGEGGGVLMNQCPHQLDLWQWLFGMPSRVQAVCGFGRYHDIEVEDDVTALLEYADGKTGVFVASTGESPGSNRLEITAERGKVVVDVSKGDVIHFDRNEVPMSKFSRTTKERSGSPERWQVEIPVRAAKVNPYTEMLRNFTAAIREGVPLIAPAAEGIHSLELGNAMLLAARQGKSLSLPMDGAEFERELSALIEASSQGRGKEG